MKIFVCIKQVPDVAAPVHSGRVVLNAYDASAVEQGLVLTELLGGEVELVLIGPDSASRIIRKALAMGATRASHIHVGEERELDSLAVSRILSDFFSSRAFDIIACGKQSQDTDAGLVGGMLAQHLGIPFATNAVALRPDESELIVTRQGDAGTEIIALQTPCLVTCSNDMNDPRIPSLRGIMSAKQKTISILEPPVGSAGGTRVDSYEELPGRPPGTMLSGGPGEMVVQLVEKLLNESRVI